MNIKNYLFSLICLLAGLAPLESATAQNSQIMKILIEKVINENNEEVTVTKLCLISTDVTCGVVDVSELVNNVLAANMQSAGKKFEIKLSADDNGEVIPANPYISTDNEK